MCKTKHRKAMETKLNRIAQLSGGNPNMEFKWLMPHYNMEYLASCFRELDGRKATGVDGVTKETYGQDLKRNIARLIKEMKTMSYRPKPVREVLIPKEGKKGKYRPLGISNVEDKIVQMMTSKTLEAIYEPIFRDCSYGFRPKRSCHTAVKAVSDYLYKNRCEVVIDVDLENFFGTISHKKITEMLRLKIKDERFIRYIVRMLKSGILSDGKFKVTEEGSPQGNVASPILSNIYAHYAIDCWFEDVVKKHTKGAVEMFRYADDLVICCRYRTDAEKVKKALKGRLGKYSLKMNEDKTEMTPFDKIEYGKGIRQGTFDFLGFTFYIGLSKKRHIIPKVKTSSKRMRTKLRIVKEWCKKYRCHVKMKPLWLKFTVKLRGHVQYYGVSFNTGNVATFIDHAVRIFYKWMNRRSQRKSLTWEEFALFRKRFPTPRPVVCNPLF